MTVSLGSLLAIVGMALVFALFVLAYAGPYLVNWQYDQLDADAFLSPPTREHPFGTTQNGFDMFALTMRGMQKSLIIGLLGALIATALAAVVGAFAGYFGGVLNAVLLTSIDLLLVLPAFLIIAILSPTFRGSTWLVFVPVWLMLVFVPTWAWVFRGDNGLLSSRGSLDFAGGTVVHVAAGASSLAMVLVLGRRQGWQTEPILPHNLPFTMLGAGILWFGWFRADIIADRARLDRLLVPISHAIGLAWSAGDSISFAFHLGCFE